MKTLNREALKAALKVVRRKGIAARMIRTRDESPDLKPEHRGWATAMPYGEDASEGAWIDYGAVGADLDDDREAIGREVRDSLEAAGLKVTWDGKGWTAIHVEPEEKPESEAFRQARDVARDAVRMVEEVAHSAALAIGYARMGLPGAVDRSEVEAGLKVAHEAATKAHADLVGPLDWRWYPDFRESLSSAWLRLVALKSALAESIR